MNRYILGLIILWVISSSQTCKQVKDTDCNGVKFFYSELVESYMEIPETPNYGTRFFDVDIYYTSSTNNLKGFTIDFKDSYYVELSNTSFEFDISPGDNTLRIYSAGVMPITDSPQLLGHLKYKVKPEDFDQTATGELRVAFLKLAGGEMDNCEFKYKTPIPNL